MIILGSNCGWLNQQYSAVKCSDSDTSAGYLLPQPKLVKLIRSHRKSIGEEESPQALFMDPTLAVCVKLRQHLMGKTGTCIGLCIMQSIYMCFLEYIFFFCTLLWNHTLVKDHFKKISPCSKGQCISLNKCVAFLSS